jgi:hypothetical protein
VEVVVAIVLDSRRLLVSTSEMDADRKSRQKQTRKLTAGTNKAGKEKLWGKKGS